MTYEISEYHDGNILARRYRVEAASVESEWAHAKTHCAPSNTVVLLKNWVTEAEHTTQPAA